MQKQYRTSCPRNCYSTCSLIVTAEEGRVIKVEGDPLHLPTRKPCLKGLSYIEEVYCRERLAYPVKRKGPRGRGEWERISWDEALDEIVHRLQTIKAESGPEAVLYYTGSGASGYLTELALAFWYQYGGYTTTYGSLCWSAGLEGTRLVYGANYHSDPEDILHSQLIILWGKNPAFTNMQESAWIMDAVEKGATLVVIDPFRTPLAEIADYFLQPRPGTDGMLALAIIRELIANGGCDREFIDRHCVGFDELRCEVESYTVERAAQETGVPAESIRMLAHLLATIKPSRIIPGYGMQRYTNGGETIRAMAMIPAITGNIGIRGGGWNYANTQSNFHFDLPLPPRPEKVRQIIPVAKLATGVQEVTHPALRMAWIERANPLSSNPNVNKLKAGFDQLEFIVVSDLFMTDTAQYADMVLPAKSLFEETDVVHSYWHSYILIREKVMEPYAGIRPETWVYRELTRRMGYDVSWIPEDTEALLDRCLREKGLNLDQMRERPLYAPWANRVAFHDFQFPTPSGKVELASAEAERRWGLTRVPHYRPPIEAGGASTSYPLHLVTIHPKGRIHNQFRYNRWLNELHHGPVLKMHIDDAIARDLHNGDSIRIFNDRGEVKARVEITWSVQPGVVIIEEGWWQEEGGSIDLLSEDRNTDIGYGTAFHDCLVEVTRDE